MVTTSSSWFDFALFVGLHVLAAGVIAALFGVLLAELSDRDQA
jgi:hypothetical protein